MNDFDVKHLLETAAHTEPRESDPVSAVLRRRRTARRRTAAAASGALAAGAAVVLAITGPGLPDLTRTHPAPPAGTTTAPPWTPPATTPGERGINGVDVTAEGYTPVAVSAAADGNAPCPQPGTISVLSTTVSGSGSCDDAYPAGAQVRPVDRLDWQFGYPASPGLTLVDGVPVFTTEALYGNESQASVTVPTRRVRIDVSGDEEQVRELLGSITIQPRPGERTAPARASRTPLALARITDSGGNHSGQSLDAGLLDRLVAVVDAADPVQGDPACLPSLENFVQIDLQTTVGSVPGEDPVDEFTYLAADVTGQCPVVFSSTGAVLRPDPAEFGAVMRRLRESND